MTDHHFPKRSKKTDEIVVVFGSTGYVGTRLVGRLLQDGYRVRVTYRTKDKLEQKSWFAHSNLDIVYCNVFEPDTIAVALKDCSYGYYLIHSMDNDQDEGYEKLDIKAAKNMVDAVNASKIKKLVYLGGLGDEKDNLSNHLQSRINTGKVLQNANTEVIILRAAILLGSGSTSFEIMRYLVDRLPVMITPRWTHKTVSQPISIRNAIEYLVGSIEVDEMKGGTYDIGGPDLLTYNEMMQIFAEENGLRKRLLIPVPVLTPALSSRWVKFITPLDEKVASRLIDGLRNDAICLNDKIKQYVPQHLLSVREAISRALNEKQYSLMRDAYGLPSDTPPIEWSQPGDPEYAGGTFFYDRRAVIAKGDSHDVWRQIESIGGKNGWYSKNFLWKVRGIIDEILGGPGIRRGRQHPTKLKVGDYLDFWRVAKVEEPNELVLRAEMKVFGIATLKFKINDYSKAKNQFMVEQHASYIPRGLAGLIYWRIVVPLHNIVFEGMLKEIVNQSKTQILYGPKPLSIFKKTQYHSQHMNSDPKK